MRIRTIKPEFYRSADIADLSIEDRLLFIGIWSYVDDNGVGRDEEDLIVIDLFPKDYFRDPAATLARVTTGLARLADAGLIVRYVVDGRSYLQVTNWGRHQRIDRPNKPRYPRSDHESAKLATTLASVATNPSWGTEDQGIRGSEDQSYAQPAVAREPNRFPDWWTIWGKKKAKGDAEKAYKAALKKISHDDLMAKTRAYWDHVKASGTDLQYVPYPATWLRAEQWDDDLTPNAKSGGRPSKPEWMKYV